MSVVRSLICAKRQDNVASVDDDEAHVPEWRVAKVPVLAGGPLDPVGFESRSRRTRRAARSDSRLEESAEDIKWSSGAMLPDAMRCDEDGAVRSWMTGRRAMVGEANWGRISPAMRNPVAERATRDESANDGRC